MHFELMFGKSVFIAGSTVLLMFFQRNFHNRVIRAKTLGKFAMDIIVNFMGSF